MALDSLNYDRYSIWADKYWRGAHPIYETKPFRYPQPWSRGVPYANDQ